MSTQAVVAVEYDRTVGDAGQARVRSVEHAHVMDSYRAAHEVEPYQAQGQIREGREVREVPGQSRPRR